jgi:hypothetical protein
MRAEEVAKYLRDHPEFFEEHTELLSTIHVPHPSGGHAIPLAERQVLTLREKGRALEAKLRELVQFGEDNDLIGDRVHRVTLALMAARDLPALLQSLHLNLHEDFRVPAVALRLWSGRTIENQPEFETVSQEARVFADSLTNPYFSDRPMFESAAWFEGATEDLRSFAYVPLATERPLGLLALASQDPARFTPDMGTLYLTRLSELVSMALKRYAED